MDASHSERLRDCAPFFEEVAADHTSAAGESDERVHQPHDAQANHVHGLIAAHAAAAKRLHDACERLDKRCVDERHVLRKPQRIVRVLLRHAKVLGKAAGIDRRAAPRRALHEVLAFASGALKTRSVVMDEDAVAGLEGRYPFSHCRNDAGRFVPQNQRRFTPNVPGHDVAAANAAGARAYEQFAGTNRGNRTLFDANVVHVVQHRCAHRLAHGCTANFMPSPPSKRSKTRSISASATVPLMSGRGSISPCARSS
jgi:hypothetical protein